MTILEATVEITIAALENSSDPKITLMYSDQRKQFLEGIKELYKTLENLEEEGKFSKQ